MPPAYHDTCGSTWRRVDAGVHVGMEAAVQRGAMALACSDAHGHMMQVRRQRSVMLPLNLRHAARSMQRKHPAVNTGAMSSNLVSLSLRSSLCRCSQIAQGVLSTNLPSILRLIVRIGPLPYLVTLEQPEQTSTRTYTASVSRRTSCSTQTTVARTHTHTAYLLSMSSAGI